MFEIGFCLTLAELREIGQDYVQLKQLKTWFVNHYPGQDWTTSFLKGHKLSLKKGDKTQLPRENFTLDPFVVYGCYEMLKKEVERLGIQERPECFYNSDELRFPRDPSKFKYVGPIG